MNYPQATKLAASMLGYGIKVERSDLATVVWPVGVVSLFTISGGRILLLRLMQEVTVEALGNDATTVKYSITTASPYAAATVDFTAASLTLASLAIGGRVQMVGTALNTAAGITSTIGPGLTVVAAPIILTPGIIKCTSAAAAATGNGVIVSSMWYYPLDDAAIVVAS